MTRGFPVSLDDEDYYFMDEDHQIDMMAEFQNTDHPAPQHAVSRTLSDMLRAGPANPTDAQL